MILAYAGRRARSLGGDPVQVAARLRRLMVALRPSAVVGAAADGADLLVLEASLTSDMSPTVHVVLPTSREVFVEDSVDAPWRDRFEAVLSESARRGGTVTTLDLDPGEAAYRAANRVILDQANDLTSASERALGLGVAREGEGQMVEEFLNRARLGRMPILRVDPSSDIEARPRCFIAMPFGRKNDAQRGIDVDCNLVYDKILVPALEHAQLNYRRADEQIDSGIVLEPMIEWIATSDLMIGDLSTGNFNVGWELGLRHILRERKTILIGPAGTTAPFDLAGLRHVRYQQDDGGISDEHAIQAWADLAPHLARCEEPLSVDSPVAAVMDVEQWGRVRRRHARDEHWESLRDRLAVARDLRDAEQMLAVQDEAEALSTERRKLIGAEVGVGLVRLGQFDQARPLLHELVQEDTNVQRPEAHVYYAQSLYRPQAAPTADLWEAERVLKSLLGRRPGHPEVRALLGAVAKRRIKLLDDPSARHTHLTSALACYRHDVEHDLNRYYAGVNVVALGTVLWLIYKDEAAERLARQLLPAVRLAAELAADRPDERYWALASVAECALHEQLLAGQADSTSVRQAFRAAGAERPPEGELQSTETQLDLLEFLGLPPEPLEEARAALREGTMGA